MKLSFFTRLDLRDSPSSELRHQKMFNDIQPFSMKPFPRLNPLCIFQMQAVLDIYRLEGKVCMLEENFYFGAHLKVSVFFIFVLGGKNANCTFCPIYD